MAIPTNKKTLIPVVTSPPVVTNNGSMSTAPGFIGESSVPTSPLYVDQRGSILQELSIEHPDGVSVLEIWASKNSLDPVNFSPDLGKVPDGENPDYSNIKWKYVGEYTLPEGEERLPSAILARLSRSRYAKIDVVRGAPIELAHSYGF